MLKNELKIVQTKTPLYFLLPNMLFDHFGYEQCVCFTAKQNQAKLFHQDKMIYITVYYFHFSLLFYFSSINRITMHMQLYTDYYNYSTEVLIHCHSCMSYQTLLETSLFTIKALSICYFTCVELEARNSLVYLYY